MAMDPVHKKFKHLLYTTRVPRPTELQVLSDGWNSKSSVVNYGVILLDEFRSKPDTKEFHYEHTNGDRLRIIPSRLQWKPHVRHMAVSLLKGSTDLTFNVDRPWKKVVEWPLQNYSPDTLEFRLLSLKYQHLAAHCDNKNALLEKIDSEIVDAEIEFGQEWLKHNYSPSKDKLREIQEYEFTRFVTFFPREELIKWMDGPQKQCLHWRGTRDSKTLTAMFFRSTKLSGTRVRRNSTVKELMYQFFVNDLPNYEALYLNFELCEHRSSCCNPYHYHCMRKQKFNNCRKRKREIENQLSSHEDSKKTEHST